MNNDKSRTTSQSKKTCIYRLVLRFRFSVPCTICREIHCCYSYCAPSGSSL